MPRFLIGVIIYIIIVAISGECQKENQEVQQVEQNCFVIDGKKTCSQ